MRVIKIGDQEYDLDSFSDLAKENLGSIQFVDNELARLQAHAAVLQTARASYSAVLSANLPQPMSETIKTS